MSCLRVRDDGAVEGEEFGGAFLAEVALEHLGVSLGQVDHDQAVEGVGELTVDDVCW